MSIRIKLILTYAILLLVSTGILMISGIAIVAGIFHDVASTVVAPGKLESILPRGIELLAELKQAEDYNPQDLISPTYIKTLSEKASFIKGGIVVKHDNTVYNYSDLPKTNALYDQLVPIPMDHSRDGVQDEDEARLIKVDDHKFFYMDYEFQTPKGPVVYYFVVDVSETRLRYGSGGTFFRVIIGLLLVMMVPLILIITQDIIKPIRQLERGVQEIKAGNLDFEMHSNKKNELGQVIRYFDVMRQALKEAIDQQLKVEENRKELISSISHDLKTPITSIKGYVEGILDGVANTPEKQDKYLKVIYEKSKDLDALIDELFMFSKLDLKKVPYHIHPVDLKAFLEGLVHEMQVGWESETQHLQLEIEAGISDIKVAIDEQHMKRVFINLIQNSMKYADKAQTRIQVVAKTVADEVEICVIDNGRGISREHLSQIFERFYRVDASRNSAAGGTGLGLAIAKQIVEQHGGTISATSDLGLSTRVCVTLKKDGKVNG